MNREEIMNMDNYNLYRNCGIFLNIIDKYNTCISGITFYNHEFAYEVEEKIKEMGLISEYMEILFPGKEQHEIYRSKTMTANIMKEIIFSKITHATPEQRCRAALLCLEGGNK